LRRDKIDAWLDEEKLLAGKNWRLEISNAVREADAVIICLSNKSISKEGFVQKEITHAIDVSEEKPEGTIYIIPVRLEDCAVPNRLNKWQWVDLFTSKGYQKLLSALTERKNTLYNSLDFGDSNKPNDINPITDSQNNQKAISSSKRKPNELIGHLLSLALISIFTLADLVQFANIFEVLGLGIFSNSVLLRFLIENYWIVVSITALFSIIVAILGLAEINDRAKIFITDYTDSPNQQKRIIKVIIYFVLLSSIFVWLIAGLASITNAFNPSPYSGSFLDILLLFSINVLASLNMLLTTMLVINSGVRSLFYFLFLPFKMLAANK